MAILRISYGMAMNLVPTQLLADGAGKMRALSMWIRPGPDSFGEVAHIGDHILLRLTETHAEVEFYQSPLGSAPLVLAPGWNLLIWMFNNLGEDSNAQFGVSHNGEALTWFPSTPLMGQLEGPVVINYKHSVAPNWDMTSIAIWEHADTLLDVASLYAAGPFNDLRNLAHKPTHWWMPTKRAISQQPTPDKQGFRIVPDLGSTTDKSPLQLHGEAVMKYASP